MTIKDIFGIIEKIYHKKMILETKKLIRLIFSQMF